MAKKPKKPDQAPPSPFDELRADDEFDKLEAAMLAYLESTRARGLKALEKMVALMEKYPGFIDRCDDVQEAATTIKRVVEAIPTKEITWVSDLLRLAEPLEEGAS